MLALNSVHKKLRKPSPAPCSALPCRIQLVRSLALIVTVATANSAAAKDLEALSNFVAPAYIAMNFAVVCAQDDRGFLSRTSGPRGTALQYAEHVKNEAIASLTYEEAVIVLKGAANAARSVARRELYNQAIKSPNVSVEIHRWCADYAIKFIRDMIKDHELTHPLLLQQIEAAKH